MLSDVTVNLLYLLSAGGFETHQEICVSCDSQFHCHLVPSYCSSLFRTGLSPALTDKTAERVAFTFWFRMLL